MKYNREYSVLFSDQLPVFCEKHKNSILKLFAKILDYIATVFLWATLGICMYNQKCIGNIKFNK